MKRIVSIIMLLLVVIAFSGVASAYSITDHGSKTSYRDSAHKDVFTWYLLSLNKNAVGFQLTDKYMYRSSGKWKLKSVIITNYYLAKLSGYTKLSTREQIVNQNGLLYQKSSISTGKSTKTAYQQFEQNKQKIINKCISDTIKYGK